MQEIVNLQDKTNILQVYKVGEFNIWLAYKI
jgi:hypothetical protein